MKGKLAPPTEPKGSGETLSSAHQAIICSRVPFGVFATTPATNALSFFRFFFSKHFFNSKIKHHGNHWQNDGRRHQKDINRWEGGGQLHHCEFAELYQLTLAEAWHGPDPAYPECYFKEFFAFKFRI